MKQKLQTRKYIVLRIILTAALIFTVSMSVFADGAVLKEYTVDANAPTVDGNRIFSDALALGDGESEYDVDILIHGIGAEWYFPYADIFRNTGRWESFSGEVLQMNPADSPLPEKLKNSLAADDAIYLDFQDEDHYPGTATVTVTLPKTFRGEQIDLYEYTYTSDKDEITDGVLTPIANGVFVGKTGEFVLTISEAHDFLIISSKIAASSGVTDDFTANILISESKSPIGDLSWTVFILLIVVCAIVVGSVAYGLFVLIRRRRVNKNAKQTKGTIEERLNELNRRETEKDKFDKS